MFSLSSFAVCHSFLLIILFSVLLSHIIIFPFITTILLFLLLFLPSFLSLFFTNYFFPHSFSIDLCSFNFPFSTYLYQFFYNQFFFFPLLILALSFTPYHYFPASLFSLISLFIHFPSVISTFGPLCLLPPTLGHSRCGAPNLPHNIKAAPVWLILLAYQPQSVHWPAY